MNRTVDLVIVGLTDAACAAAIAAARRQCRVLIAGGSSNAADRRRLGRLLKASGNGRGSRVSVLTGVEVVCVDGTTAIEVVLLRRMASGQLIGINTSAVLVTTALLPSVLSPAVRSRVELLNPS